MPGSNASSASSARASKNWIVKNGLPAVFSIHQLSQGSRAPMLRMQGIREQPLHVVRHEGRKPDLPHPPPGIPDRREHPRERVRGTDLVVPVGADQQQVPHLRVRDKMLHQIKGRRVQPLQIVEEQRERVLRPGEHAEETPEHQLEASLLVLGRKLGRRRLLTDDERKLRDQIDHQLAVRAKRLQQRVAPLAQLRVALAEDLIDQALEGLSQRRVRDVSLVLVELARGKQATRRDQLLVQLIDERGLADPGVAGHQHELGRAAGHDPIERRDERVDLGLPAIELFGDQQPVRRIVRTQREWLDAHRAPPRRSGTRRRSASTPAAVW